MDSSGDYGFIGIPIPLPSALLCWALVYWDWRVEEIQEKVGNPRSPHD
jgi:hypothetical protein